MTVKKPITSQALFNKVARHLLTQNKRSFEEGMCRYRTSKGLRCAVGCLIPDKEYFPGMEGKTLDVWIVDLIPFKLTDEQAFILQKLQDIHDLAPVKSWKENLAELAKFYNLHRRVLG